MSASFLEAATHRTADARGSTILKAAEVQTITDALSTLAVTDEESIRCAAQAMDRETLRRCRGNLAKLKDVLDDICESATPELCRFPPGRPDIELYSQMLETTSNRIDHFEFGAHVYINGQKLRPEASRYEGFRVVQFDRRWSVLSDDVYEIYGDYERGGDNPKKMRDSISRMELGNPVAVITGDAAGTSDGSSFVANTLREALALLGASVFPTEFRMDNRRAKKPSRHDTVIRFAYAALLIRGAPPGTYGLVESFQDYCWLGPHTHVVLAAPGAPAHARLASFLKLAQAQTPPQEPVPEGIFDGVRCILSGMCPIIGNRYELPGKVPWYNLCEAEYSRLPAHEQALYLKFEPTHFLRRLGSATGGSAPIDVAALQREIGAARLAGVPETLLEQASKAMEGEQQRRARVAMEINIRAVCGEGTPADLLAYLRSLRAWIPRAELLHADVEPIHMRFKKELPGVEALLSQALEPDAPDGIPSDLERLERSLEMAVVAGVAEPVVAAAAEALAAHRKRRKEQAALEEQLLALQKREWSDDPTSAVAAAADLVKRARAAGLNETLVQAIERRIEREEKLKTTGVLELQLRAVCAELGMLRGPDDGSDEEASAVGRGSDHESRYQIETLVFGLPVDAARGLAYYCHVSDEELNRAKALGVEAIRAEFRGLTHERAAEDNECVDYVLDAEAGSSEKRFQGGLMRDRDRFGNVLASRQVDDGNGGRRGMRLEDFLRTPSAILAGLSLADVASVRIYSTAAFRSINNPLRDMDRHLAGMPHPLPVTVSFLQDAVKKLRSVDAVSQSRNDEVLLWRGMSNRTCSTDFFRDGGTELAPMSTTTSLKTAVEYSASESSVLLRLATSSFMARGADISFLSAFEAEREVLFPPLTYLRVGEQHEIQIKESGLSFTVIDVTPMLS